MVDFKCALRKIRVLSGVTRSIMGNARTNSEPMATLGARAEWVAKTNRRKRGVEACGARVKLIETLARAGRSEILSHRESNPSAQRVPQFPT